MDSQPATGPTRADSSHALGVLDLLGGCGYAALAAVVATQASSPGHQGRGPWRPVASLFGLSPALVIGFAVILASIALLGLLAGAGVLRGRAWGRVLTRVMAVLAMLFGLLWAWGSDSEPLDV